RGRAGRGGGRGGGGGGGGPAGPASGGPHGGEGEARDRGRRWPRRGPRREPARGVLDAGEALRKVDERGRQVVGLEPQRRRRRGVQAERPLAERPWQRGERERQRAAERLPRRRAF